MSINRVNITGNLTRDPELRATAAGTQVLSFGIAVNDRRKNPQTGEWEDYPNYIDCTMFGTRAEAVGRYISKGSKVAIEGKLRYSSWERDGQKRSKLEVIVDEIEFMNSRPPRLLLPRLMVDSSMRSPRLPPSRLRTRTSRSSRPVQPHTQVIAPPETAGLFHAVARLHTFPTPGCLWDGWGPAGHPAMEIAGQGPADRCPGGPLGKLSNYADAYVRIYVLVRLRMCAAGYIHTSGKGGRDRVGAGSPNIGRRPSWPVARGK